MVIIPRAWAHEEARRLPRYNAKRTDRIHHLIQDYVNTHPLVCGADPEERYQECERYVREQYSVGLTGLEFLLWPIISGAIAWLVGRLLDRSFPKEDAP
jgi:hypothetical protein